MVRLLIGLLLAISLAACGDDVQLRLSNSLHYDDFSGSAVDLAKWTVNTSGDGVTGTATQTVAGGRVTLDMTAVSGNIQSSLRFPVSLVGRIGHIGARARVLSDSEGPGSTVRFRLYLRAYKDNKYASGPAPDVTSDIFAQLRIRNGLLQAMVSRCLDPTCSTSELAFGAVTLGTATLGRYYDLSLGWNGGTLFYFAVAGIGSTFFDATEGGTYATIGASGTPRAQVEVIAENGAPTTGSVTADVDYVACSRWGGDLC